MTGSAGSESAGWPESGRFTARARQVTCVVRPGTWAHLSATAASLNWRIVSSESAVTVCNDALKQASAAREPLLLLEGPVEATDEAVFVMHQELQRDPMFGCASARIRCEDGCCFRGFSGRGRQAPAWILRQTLAETPDIEVYPELFESCMLVAPDVAAEFGELHTTFTGVAASLVHYLSRARRCGYRTVVANRAVMGISGLRCDGRPDTASAVPDRDRALLQRLTPDLDRAWDEFRAASNARFERLSAEALRAADGITRPSLLVDIRNVVAVHNGTAQAALGNLRALRGLSPPWDIAVLANTRAVKFHSLAELCRGWDLHTALPERPFAAALRLSQPWHIQEMIDLHEAAFFNVYFMLDTISWDTVYGAPPFTDGTWSFLAEHADGFLFNSAFTERRFLTRFSDAHDKPRAVCHHSFDPAEYVDARAKRTTTSDYILVVGNELDHKDAVETVNLLSGAFPYQRVISFGPRPAESPFVTIHRSGVLPEIEIQKLYAGARLIVFPSFYEGFGFPIVTALAYGKTLVARRSELLGEIAGQCQGTTGRLVSFERRDELVNIIGRLLHREVVPEDRVGTARSGKPRTWRDVASEIVAFIDRVARHPVGGRWRAREHAANQARAFQSK